MIKNKRMVSVILAGLIGLVSGVMHAGDQLTITNSTPWTIKVRALRNGTDIESDPVFTIESGKTDGPHDVGSFSRIQVRNAAWDSGALWVYPQGNWPEGRSFFSNFSANVQWEHPRGWYLINRRSF